MPNSPAKKLKALRDSGTLNPRPEQVRHQLFSDSLFFDPNDLLQLKYEMLRSLQTDQLSVTQVSEDFGFSRPTIYQTKADFKAAGLGGLLPQKRGPKNPHKLTRQVMDYLLKLQTDDPALASSALAKKVKQRWGATLHPRTIEKALAARAKRGRRKL